MIRPYEPTDKNQLLQLIRLNTPKYFAPSEEADLIDYLDNTIENYFVVESAKKIIGAGGINTVKDQEDTMRISWDMVHPEHQRQGIGKQLTLHRIEVIRKKPTIKKIQVRTSQHTDQFYQKMGFKLMNIEKDYWSPGFDLYDMVLVLRKK